MSSDLDYFEKWIHEDAQMRSLLQEVREHLAELADAWERGVIAEYDGQGGARSNRNRQLLWDIEDMLRELGDG